MSVQSEPLFAKAYANSSPFSENASLFKDTVPSVDKVFGSKKTSGDDNTRSKVGAV